MIIFAGVIFSILFASPAPLRNVAGFFPARAFSGDLRRL